MSPSAIPSSSKLVPCDAKLHVSNPLPAALHGHNESPVIDNQSLQIKHLDSLNTKPTTIRKSNVHALRTFMPFNAFYSQPLLLHNAGNGYLVPSLCQQGMQPVQWR